MAAFPAVEPESRSYTFGEFPATVVPSQAGATRFLHGSVVTGSELKLSFENINAAEASQIRSHYRGQQGTCLPFVLPAVIWSGHTSTPSIMASETLWRYSRSPEERQRSGGLVDLTVELVSVI